MMKRYWLFIYDIYYPSGGMNDFHGEYDTLEEALKAKTDNVKVSSIDGEYMQNYHVYDIELRKIIKGDSWG